MNKKMIRIFLLLLPIIISGVANADDRPPDIVKKAAIEGMVNFIRNNNIEQSSAELGQGFQEYFIRHEKISNYQAFPEFHSVVSPTSKWHFIVLSKNKPIILLNVLFHNGKWQAVGYGASVLAREIAGFSSTFPASSGYRFRVINDLQLDSYFLELSQGKKVVGIFCLTELMLKKNRSLGTFSLADAYSPRMFLAGRRVHLKSGTEKRHK